MDNGLVEVRRGRYTVGLIKNGRCFGCLTMQLFVDLDKEMTMLKSEKIFFD